MAFSGFFIEGDIIFWEGGIQINCKELKLKKIVNRYLLFGTKKRPWEAKYPPSVGMHMYTYIYTYICALNIKTICSEYFIKYNRCT